MRMDGEKVEGLMKSVWIPPLGSGVAIRFESATRRSQPHRKDLITFIGFTLIGSYLIAHLRQDFKMPPK